MPQQALRREHGRNYIHQAEHCPVSPQLSGSHPWSEVGNLHQMVGVLRAGMGRKSDDARETGKSVSAGVRNGDEQREAPWHPPLGESGGHHARATPLWGVLPMAAQAASCHTHVCHLALSRAPTAEARSTVAKPKISTSWLFIEKVCQAPLSISTGPSPG